MLQDMPKNQGNPDEHVLPKTPGAMSPHLMPKPQSMTYTLHGQEFKASIISRSDEAHMNQVNALRAKLFGHYQIPGSSEKGDRDQFDTEPSFHVLLESNGKSVGVARLQPVSSRDGILLPHLSANFSLFEPRNVYQDPRQVIDMSRVDVLPDALKGSFEVLVAACIDLSSASGFSTIVAFTPRGIGDYLTELGIPFEVLSGDRCYVATSSATATAPSQSIELIITSFNTGRDIAERFLAHVGAHLAAR